MVVALTSKKNSPGATVDDIVKVSVDVCGPEVRSSVVELKAGLMISGGTLTVESVTVPANPSIGVSVIVEVPDPLCWRMKKSGDAEMLKSAVGVQAGLGGGGWACAGRGA